MAKATIMTNDVTKVCYISDIHLEMNAGPDIQELIKIKPDVVILAGDIHVGADNIIKSLLYYQQQTNAYIIHVSGNHEYYDSVPTDYTDALLCNEFYSNDKIFVLHNDKIIINNILFFGGTLWTDFEVDGAEYKWFIKENIKKSMNDFRVINVIRKDGKIKKFTTDYWQGFHNRTRTYIYNTLKNNNNNYKTILITHHGGNEVVNGDAYYKQKCRGGYVSNCNDIYEPEFAPNYWISGHTHERIEKQINNTAFLSNCYGYEQYETSFVKQFVWKTFEI